MYVYIRFNFGFAYLSLCPCPMFDCKLNPFHVFLCTSLVKKKHSCVNNVHTEHTYRSLWPDWLEPICVVCIVYCK